MKYREILKKRTQARDKVEDLKTARELYKKDDSLNKDIEREKFKYMVYNKLLKIGGKDE